MILLVPPRVGRSEPERLEQAPRGPVLLENVQRRRTRPALQRRREERPTDAGPLVVGVDEELIDVRAFRRDDQEA